MEQEERLREHPESKLHGHLIETPSAEMLGLIFNNESLKKSIMQAGFNPDSAQALFFVPLVEVAWADGEIQSDERDEILKMLAKRGIEEKSEALALVSGWLTERPIEAVFFKAQILHGLIVDEMRKHEEGSVMWILENSRRIASATGGRLSRIGIGSSTSPDEDVVIQGIASRIQKK